MTKQLNLIQTSPQVKELLKAAAELRAISIKIEYQAHQINKAEHPELMTKQFTFTQDWDIHIIGETEQGNIRYLTPEEIAAIYPEKDAGQ
jgi:hypothetical protein